MRSTVWVFVLLLLLVPAYGPAYAESQDRDENWWYIAAFAGGVSPDDYSDVDRNGTGISRLKMKDGYTGGLKLGFVPGKRWTWINWEFEYWYANPRIKGQTVDKPAPVSLAGTNLHVHTFSWNFILRRHDAFIEPYIGIGPSLVYTNANGAQLSDSQAAFGVNFLGGVRIMAFEKIGIFAEAKYNRSNLDINSLSGEYRPLAAVVGIVYHFDSVPTLLP